MATEDECLEALRRAAERLGESPTKAQYEELGLTPASATIMRILGGWNAAKEEAGLETARSSGSRVAPKPDHVDLPDGLAWEELTVDQRWHYRNVEWNTERTRRRRGRLRAWVRKRKHERGCSRCGIENAACLEFHHREEAEKLMDVGEMVTYGYGIDRLRAEIEKCTVLCANCHRTLHYTPPGRELRRWIHDRKRNSGCERCAEADPACLDFHHLADSTTTVATLVSDDRSKERIRAEIEKCMVLCANCHRKEHYEPPEYESLARFEFEADR